MLKIKLLPRGKKHQITYRIVVAQDRSKSDGKFIADLGFFTPQTKTLNLDQVKMDQWIKDGAQLTTGVDKLLNPDKYPKKIKKVKEAKSEEVKETEVVETEKEQTKSEEAVVSTETEKSE